VTYRGHIRRDLSRVLVHMIVVAGSSHFIMCSSLSLLLPSPTMGGGDDPFPGLFVVPVGLYMMLCFLHLIVPFLPQQAQHFPSQAAWGWP
jgi:hypothetical protein